MIDTHAHLNFEVFKKDYQEVTGRSFDNQVKAIINVGSDLTTSERACQIAKESSKVYAAVGLHPIHVKDEDFEEKKYEALINENKQYIKAIGETGLDYFHVFQEVKETKKQKEIIEKQKEVFKRHIDLAKRFNLPVILHSRSLGSESEKSYLDLLSIIQKLKFLPKGVVHCFSASWQIAEKFLEKGFYLGLNGVITFPNFKYKEVVEKTPLEKIVLETDCPYLAPQQVRGTRNEPKNIFYIAQEIARIKNKTLKEVSMATDQNATRLFSLGE